MRKTKLGSIIFLYCLQRSNGLFLNLLLKKRPSTSFDLIQCHFNKDNWRSLNSRQVHFPLLSAPIGVFECPALQFFLRNKNQSSSLKKYKNKINRAHTNSNLSRELEVWAINYLLPNSKSLLHGNVPIHPASPTMAFTLPCLHLSHPRLLSAAVTKP